MTDAPHTARRADENGGQGLGTFAGVFTPSILTILGLILFLRLGYVIGQVGLARSLLIVVLATSVSVLTSISLATATSNLRIRGGGVYFLISRTLGIEFGGAVGLVLFVAMSVSVAFYSIGLAEAVIAMTGNSSAIAERLVAAACVLVLLGFALLGADWATRLQFLVMGLLVVALLSFFVGAIPDISAGTLGDGLGRPETDVGFWEAFAIFFPAITGFTQGVAMSGDLRTPSRSIVVGTFLAVGVSTLIYVAMMITLAGAESLAELRDNTTTVIGDLSLVGWTADAGVIAATLSSAMASLLGAPRVLQRLAADRVVPPLKPFATGVGPTNNPRRGVLLSAAIAFGIVLVGDVNTVAPVISMFFLVSYGLINYATFYEARAASPSFRPRFRWYHPRVSLVGAAACALAVIFINPIAGAAAALVLWSIQWYLRRQDVHERWSDSVHAHHYAEARRHLLALRHEQGAERDWRPGLLVFVPQDVTARHRLLRMATWLEGAAGFATAVRVIEGSGARLRRRTAEVGASLQQEIADADLPVFARAVLAADLRTGVQSIVQSHGLGDLRPNTAVFGWHDLEDSGDEAHQRYGRALQECARFSTNVVIIRADDEAWERFDRTPADQRTIRVWWSNDRAGQLMTLLAWLCTRSDEWGKAAIEVVVPNSAETVSQMTTVRSMLDDARITARVVEVDGSPEAIRPALEDATMVIAPLRVRRQEPLGPHDTPIAELDCGPALTVLVLAIDEVEIDVEPDESQVARHAQAQDAAHEASRRADELDAEAARLLVEAEMLRLELDKAAFAELEGHQLAEAVARAEHDAAMAFRRYVDARARAEERRIEADECDPAREQNLIDPSRWKAGVESGPP